MLNHRIVIIVDCGYLVSEFLDNYWMCNRKNDKCWTYYYVDIHVLTFFK
jgi:exosome complex RNA-binding protein Rrp42 (RNase PH superfamily)